MSIVHDYIVRFAPHRNIFDYRLARKEQIGECPSCEESDTRNFQTFLEIDRYGYGAKTERCLQCGLIFINPRLSIEQYAEIYDQGIYRQLISAYSGGKDDHSLSPDRVIRISEHIASRLSGRSVNVLNIGGTSSDYEILKSRITLNQYVCINPGLEEAGRGYEVIKTTFEDFEPKQRKFDLVCLFGTLNHLMWPLRSFRKIASVLSHDGIFAFDYKDPIIKMKRMTNPSGAIQFDHPIYPTPFTLRVLLKRLNFAFPAIFTDNNRVFFYLVSPGYQTSLEQFEFKSEAAVVSELRSRGRKLSLGMLVRALTSVV